MSVLGIDLSLTSTGVAVIDNAGAVTFSIKSKGKTAAPLVDRSERIRRIVDELTDWIPDDCELAVIESMFSSMGAGTLDRAWLWGRVVDRLIANDLPVATVTPGTVKRWATGSGSAEKLTMGVHVGRLWPAVQFSSDDEVDALAIAHMGACWLGYEVPRLARHDEAGLKAAKWPVIDRQNGANA